MRKSQAVVTGLYNSRASSILRALIREVDDCDTIYHVHNWTKVLSPSIFGALRSVDERLVITAHDYFMACPNGGFFNFKSKKLCELAPLSLSCIKSNCVRGSGIEKVWRSVRHVERRLLGEPSSVATVLAVHEAMVPLLIRGGVNAAKLAVLRNPVQPWMSERAAVEHNAPMLFVGRLEYDKGPHLLARAARAAGVQAIFVGDGPLRQEMEQNYPEFQLLGWKTRPQLAKIAASSRAVVMPTGSRETFGLVAFEALASGIPVIVSDFSSTSSEITRNKIGFSCDPYDQERLASLLHIIATDDALCEEMSRRAWGLRHTIAATVADWGSILVNTYQNKLNIKEPSAQRLPA